MEKIYCNNICVPKSEEGKNICLSLYSAHKEVKKILNEDDYKKWSVKLHNYIREIFDDFPNKIFTIAVSEDGMNGQFIFFPKEPDGNCYEAYYDEELKLSYILV